MEKFMAGAPDKQRLDGKAKGRESSMTAAQAVTLKELAAEGREPEAYQDKLSAESAALRIRVLQAKLAKDISGEQHKPD
jgi:hypothetical protein